MKFIDDFSSACSYNLLKVLEKEDRPLPRPLTFQQRTGYRIKEEENLTQKDADDFKSFTDHNQFKINEKKSEIMVFYFSSKLSFPQTFLLVIQMSYRRFQKLKFWVFLFNQT